MVLLLNYGGPSKFSPVYSEQELNRVGEFLVEVDNGFRNGTPPIFPVKLGKERGARCTLIAGGAVRVDTSSGNTVTAVLPDVVRSAGKTAILVRTSALGAVDVISSERVLVDDQVVFSVSGAVGAFPFYSDGEQWFSLR